MKKQLSKVLALALSLVMAIGLLAIDAPLASAAKKTKKLSFVTTGKKSVKSGQKRTIKIKGTDAKKAKWSLSGNGKKYVSLNRKKGSTVKMTVKENATGKVKVTAKLTNKNKVSVTYKLSHPEPVIELSSITLESKDIYTGEAASLALTKTPENAELTDEVTYSVFTDEAATISTLNAVVTPGAMGCEFSASKAGTYYVKAACGDLTCISKVNVTDKIIYATAISFTSGASIVTGEKAELKLNVTPANGQLAAAVTYGLYYESNAINAVPSSAAVVSPTADGCSVTATQNGTYYVKAVSGTLNCIATVTVNPKVDITNMSLEDKSAYTNEMISIPLTVDPENGYRAGVKYAVYTDDAMSITASAVDVTVTKTTTGCNFIAHKPAIYYIKAAYEDAAVCYATVVVSNR